MIDGLGKRMNDSIAYLGERITSVETTSEEWRHDERKAREAGQVSYRAIFLVVGGILFLVVLALIALAIIVASRFAGQIS
jgi:nitrogen fixation/metabolism regulation signal transduction histidine kinase